MQINMNNVTCPLQIAANMINGKWKSIIIFQLSLGNSSLSKLQKDIIGISQKMLLEHLNQLRENGLVDKITYDGYPLKVEYFLTNRGKQMLKAIIIFQEIGIEVLKEKKLFNALNEKSLSYIRKSK
ncbi:MULTISPECIES: winged helix-turn-helix transcriptional regulator [unclassified Campylobacter]|uniref:winged helix-turn-helix transcriptional regulator n=1 Tax=unclassified Campylobacter TaxID=2593542 RepID=UPI001D7B9848|nr:MULTISPECIES: helix-turn-helix domain-containing protein [unclassified Campylobacter]MBZ7976473.1 helix-turn-helix transcriptional regulator [Campylobacter sp. RM12637]MBZ7979951.1 helix-turn-helix transcriptional regulator [Campylobacter sp. RM12642]MBZ7991172.1 helix-turn-helix transcriptional regulator [Campylobacter sp. RM9331]MBZ8005665.1 helix-turn-helix transcriptional regulator [Campylobacter sp. RM9332]MBZ8008470.1 helix-turn-helix transcriptional regulator [Campylobacter sp. RM933